MGRLQNLTGLRFGRLTVICRAENKGRQTAWLCKCDCGNKKEVMSSHLIRGLTKSCGCLSVEALVSRNEKHGHRRERIYAVWSGIKARCHDEKNPRYKDYGGRGITVCAEWLNDFQAFYDWAMANGYTDNLTIDRKDNNKGYSPDNCRWATHKEQNDNRRCTLIITYNGTTQTLSMWANELKVPYKKLWSRLYRCGWTVERAFNTP